jgi:protein-S-isoprenylcysteine O-methyltransferase Ste14
MSHFLVAAQFVLIALIAWPFAAAPALKAFPLLLFLAGIAVALAAVLAMGARTVSILPEPRPGGVLVTHGIYRYLRHPMYLAVLLCALAACLAYQNPVKWGLAALLLMVLALKIRREERLLRQHFADYAEYARHTAALLPFLF